MNSKSVVYRALVTYSNERTGEIRVKIPSIIGVATDVSITYIGRAAYNGVWAVPQPGEQIIVSPDDDNLTNVFWLHTDAYTHTSHQRNYIQVYNTTYLYPAPTAVQTASFDTVDLQSGIRLVDSTKITFDYAGVYDLHYSVQWANISSQIHEGAIWISFNGNYYPNSATYTAVTSSHGGLPGSAIAASNLMGKAINAGDYVELMWATTSNQVYPVSLSPSDVGLDSSIPVSKAVVVSITQVA
jgi:hypothetical protein